MTRILKRGQKTYFKEDVVACLADETIGTMSRKRTHKIDKF